MEGLEDADFDELQLLLDEMDDVRRALVAARGTDYPDQVQQQMDEEGGDDLSLAMAGRGAHGREGQEEEEEDEEEGKGLEMERWEAGSYLAADERLQRWLAAGGQRRGRAKGHVAQPQVRAQQVQE
jgi:hypothetical protein